MSRTRVVLVSAAIVAGIATLIWTLLAFTPLRQLLPLDLGGNLRNQYLETSLKLDSLEYKSRINDAYITNIVSIMNDNLPSDSAIRMATEKILASDSSLMATEEERQFVRRYEEEERFNLSVLSPIAAEGMIFTSPVSTYTAVEPVSSPSAGVRISGGVNMPVAAVYRGSVVAVNTLADGTSTVALQHPNDFISIYSGINDVFVSKGKKVAAGQRLGHSSGKAPVVFELWHNGTALNPGDYISF